MTSREALAPFSEKAFYLQEFRGRTLGFVAPAQDLASAEPLAAVIAELAANATRSLVVSDDPIGLEKLVGRAPLPAATPGLPGAVWRALAERPAAAVVVASGEALAAAARRLALRLGLTKLVYLDAAGGLVRPDGKRISFVDLAELRAGPADKRDALLAEIRALLEAGFPAVNLCTQDGLADELFTYTGSGTLFTREGYVAVRRLGLDDFDAAADLIARGVEEGFLAPRTAPDVDAVLAHGFGAFVEGVHLAGIGALLAHPASQSGEIASLYTLTRFLGEGVGGQLVGFALDEARRRGMERVFACTTSERVGAFFERLGFVRVPPEDLPAEKWAGYDPERRARVHCFNRMVG
jgi:amino-acid N-acetyltransferase